MLGADLVGFHTRSYVIQFLNCCERILGLRVDRTRDEVATHHGPVRVGTFPLGIPADYFAGLAASPRVRERTDRIRRALRTPHVVLGVDRLDYTKGILERLLGFERFLEANPAYHRRVTLVLIAVPSRTKVADYMALKRELDELGLAASSVTFHPRVGCRFAIFIRNSAPRNWSAYYRAATSPW